MKIAVLMNHKLNEEQIRDLRENFGITDIIYAPENVKAKWEQIPANMNFNELIEYLEPVKEWLFKTNANNAIIVGEPTASLIMQTFFLNQVGGTLFFATTKREAIEKVVNGKVVKTSVFNHVGFRIVTKGLLEGGKND